MDRCLPAILFHSMSLWSILLHPTPLFQPTLVQAIVFHSSHDSTPLHSTPLRDLDHAVCIGAAWLDQSFNLGEGLYLPTTRGITVRIWSIYPVSWHTEQDLECLIPFNPHKALRCAYVTTLLIQMRKLAYTVTKWYAPSRKTNRSQVCDVTPGIRTPAFPLI